MVCFYVHWGGAVEPAHFPAPVAALGVTPAAEAPVLVELRSAALQPLRQTSWHIGRDAAPPEHGAARAPVNRYRAAQPLLLTGTVEKENVLAVKLGRDEAEIVTFSARRQRVDSLLAGPAKRVA